MLTYHMQILVIEGLHPFYDPRVRDLLDFKIYLDISDDIKFAWKIQRDMAERGHSLASIKASIEARKPDFDAYIDPQKAHADIVIQVSKPGDLTVPSAECAPVHNLQTCVLSALNAHTDSSSQRRKWEVNQPVPCLEVYIAVTCASGPGFMLTGFPVQCL